MTRVAREELDQLGDDIDECNVMYLPQVCEGSSLKMHYNVPYYTLYLFHCYIIYIMNYGISITK